MHLPLTTRDRSILARDHCVKDENNNQFFKPSSADTFRTGDTIPLRWHAGTAPSPSASQPDVLVDIILSSKSIGNRTIADGTLFLYQPAHQDNGKSWTSLDDCNNTQMTYDWTIPADQRADYDTKYTIYVTHANSTRIMASSQLFLILPADRLPPSAKIVLGVAAVLGLLALVVMGGLAWRGRQRTRYSDVASAGPEEEEEEEEEEECDDAKDRPDTPASSEKKEKKEETRIAEIGGGDIAEAAGWDIVEIAGWEKNPDRYDDDSFAFALGRKSAAALRCGVQELDGGSVVCPLARAVGGIRGRKSMETMRKEAVEM